jgi:hypothetical protein
LDFTNKFLDDWNFYNICGIYRKYISCSFLNNLGTNVPKGLPIDIFSFYAFQESCISNYRWFNRLKLYIYYKLKNVPII